MPQISPSPFVRAYDSTIQAGQQLQNLGLGFVELISKQKTLADDLAYGELLADFKNEQKLNEGKLIQFSKSAPSELAPDEFGDYPLAAKAFVLGSDTQSKLLQSNKFKNLGMNAKDCKKRW